MTADLVVNGREQNYPGDLSNLEELVSYAHKREPGVNIIVKVEVDGETFSETYPHQAQALKLEAIETVAVTSISGEEFTRDFIRQAPELVAHIRTGFATASEFFKTPGSEFDGHEIMAKSLEALRALKLHCDMVERNSFSDLNRDLNDGWEAFHPVAEALMDAQHGGEISDIAELLDTRMLPFLKSLQQTLQ